MDLELTAKRAIVTGGSRGIGKAIARQLAEEGAQVVIAARDRLALDSAARELTVTTGAQVEPVVADTRSDASVNELVSRTVELLGGVDILVNNAAVPGGIGGRDGPLVAELQNLANDFDGKVLGYLRCAQAAAPHMVRQGWGRIINIGGLSARQAGSLSASVRNVAVAALSKTLADDLGRHGVNVNTVHPGATRTEKLDERLANTADSQEAATMLAEMATRVSIGRIVDATEVAWVVAFLASTRSVAINGDVIDCGGGSLGPIHY
jgi:NAD(P)-dependent dehydrogenase (short-subunit alcohol dehydrogenase family)